MSAELRHCYRFPLAAEEGDTLLEVRGQRRTVRLVDRSAEGFCVESSECLAVEIGSEVMVLSPTGWHQAEVVRCQPTGSGVRLGLYRVGDIVETRKGRRVARKRDAYTPWSPSPGFLIALGFLFLIGGACYVLTNGDWRDMVDYMKQARMADQRESRK